MRSAVSIETPPSTDFDPGVVAVVLFDGAGQAVQVATDGSNTQTSGEPDSSEPAAEVAPGGLTCGYVPDPKITAQTDYVLAHWSDDTSATYGSIADNDCVNFTSQSLEARGWTMDADWSFNPATREYSPAWASSTALSAYLAGHPERATALSDTQRDLVKVGDIVQFDWDASGDKDHTGIVTRVERTDAGIRLFYAGHTTNTNYKSVDESLADAGGDVSFWSVA
ncbi:MAG: amidase domain-containing protein [Ramlibacter sp.]|nr:amidase domain-containing protein [Cryobacterium sp.]